MKVICIIPIHMQSKRFPGKPLALISKFPIVLHVYARCTRAEFDSVYIAYCDDEVKRTIDNTVLIKTPSEVKNGTERCYYAAKSLGLGVDDYIVNVQGDEPMIKPSMLKQFKEWLLKEKPRFATIAVDVGLSSTNVVKVIPKRVYSSGLVELASDFVRTPIYKHIGVYGYTVGTLGLYATFPETKGEKERELEQLRFMNSLGVWDITCRLFVYKGYKGIAVNTKEDLEKVKELI